MPKIHAVITLDPNAVKRYDCEYELMVGDFITASVWTLPAGLVQPYADSFGTTYTTLWISAPGIAEGTKYTVTNRITTDAGEIDDRSFLVEIVEQ